MQFFILVLCPSEVKQTKSALETGRTFSTLFSDVGLRHELLEATNVNGFKAAIKRATAMFADHQKLQLPEIASQPDNDDGTIKCFQVGKGIRDDLMRRLPYYLDDFKDGLVGKNTVSKTISTTLFLYFSVILPAVALGVLNSDNTHGKISVPQVILGEKSEQTGFKAQLTT